MVETTQCEYRALSAGTFWTMPKDEDLEALLNDLGADGWEVVSILSQYGSKQVRVVAKRPLTASTRRRRSWPG